MSTRLHATTVALDGRGAMLRGPSGSGKSDLALRLIDEGAALVADDYTELTVRDGVLWAAAPEAIAGFLEVRGVGVVRLPPSEAVPVALVVDLAATAEAVERLPDPETAEPLPGHAVRRIVLRPFEASAPAKVRLAVRLVTGDILSTP